jgi:hypothetical protein
MFRATADGAAAASLADSGPTYGTGTTTGTTLTGGTGFETGQSSTDSPGTTGYDTPVPPPTLTTPASTDPTTSGLPGQRTQDAP